ncbi:helix-turn-helix domain-containing protein [Psychrobacillus sp. INOP01]|uniref:helix-turn-helix domain-containing protein n=1 Tax=Psychrobacillus sp. INOP01 TaxID=2829187 RepID=UPI001BA7822C|nr:helix-turn-helix domain-containing protein [Psychrobacillus sp. INOP01]QUG41388.1 helix-turn-helix domain-containing protein [Psychrobacillus sp. INOP01]
MHFHQILLFIIHKITGQRSENAPYYLLKGKKSGQTIQDVTYFQLHAFFSILPQLSKEDYDTAINDLFKEEFIQLNESLVYITNKGVKALPQDKKLRLNGWQYRGKEQIFWKRIDLVVQTLSQFQANEKKFVPNQKDIANQHFVKDFLIQHNFRHSNLKNDIKQEIFHLLENSTLDDIHRTLFVYRFSGYNKTGLTWEQLARYYQMTDLDIKITFLECLHCMLDNISMETSPRLFDLAKDIHIDSPLTESAFRTNSLFEKGYSIEQIARIRKLKINTIEDHVIEIVSNNKNFSISPFISSEQVEGILHLSNELHTKKLTLIKDRLPEVSYFQVRLALTKGEQIHE